MVENGGVFSKANKVLITLSSLPNVNQLEKNLWTSVILSLFPFMKKYSKIDKNYSTKETEYK